MDMITILRAVHQSADAFPLLMSAAGDVLFITETVSVSFKFHFFSRECHLYYDQKFKWNQKEWKELGGYVERMLVAVIQGLPAPTDHDTSRTNLEYNIQQLWE
jgi:hypothetical protein